MLEGKRCEIFYDFVVPECPRAIVFDGGALAVADGEGKDDENTAFLLAESEKLNAITEMELDEERESIIILAPADVSARILEDVNEKYGLNVRVYKVIEELNKREINIQENKEEEKNYGEIHDRN